MASAALVGRAGLDMPRNSLDFGRVRRGPGWPAAARRSGRTSGDGSRRPLSNRLLGGRDLRLAAGDLGADRRALEAARLEAEPANGERDRDEDDRVRQPVERPDEIREE